MGYFWRSIGIKIIISKEKNNQNTNILFFTDFEIKILKSTMHLLIDRTYMYLLGYI